MGWIFAGYKGSNNGIEGNGMKAHVMRNNKIYGGILFAISILLLMNSVGLAAWLSGYMTEATDFSGGASSWSNLPYVLGTEDGNDASCTTSQTGDSCSIWMETGGYG